MLGTVFGDIVGSAVPQSVIESMMGKLVLPEAYEAQNVEWLPV